MKAIWNNRTIADAPREDLIRIEGNWYFPPTSIKREYFKDSDTHTQCFWKGQASYKTIDIEGDSNQDAAWYYPEPMAGSIERVKKDFTNYFAFWHGVEVTE